MNYVIVSSEYPNTNYLTELLLFNCFGNYTNHSLFLRSLLPFPDFGSVIYLPSNIMTHSLMDKKVINAAISILLLVFSLFVCYLVNRWTLIGSYMVGFLLNFLALILPPLVNYYCYCSLLFCHQDTVLNEV